MIPNFEGDKALVAWPLVEELFLLLPWRIFYPTDFKVQAEAQANVFAS